VTWLVAAASLFATWLNIRKVRACFAIWLSTHVAWPPTTSPTASRRRAGSCPSTRGSRSTDTSCGGAYSAKRQRRGRVTLPPDRQPSRTSIRSCPWIASWSG
jgi:hypothetical protein